jgi:hypothetical protein
VVVGPVVGGTVVGGAVVGGAVVGGAVVTGVVTTENVVVGASVVIYGDAVVVTRPPHWPEHVPGHSERVMLLRQSEAVNLYEAHMALSVHCMVV